MQKESNPSKRSWIIILNEPLRKSNYYILILNTNTKQFYLQLQNLLTNKKLFHRNNLRTVVCKHFYGSLRKKLLIPIYQDIFTYILQVYRQPNFYMDRQ